MFENFINAAKTAKQRSARSYYATAYGITLAAAIFELTILGAEDEDVHTPYYLLLYAGAVMAANLVASLEFHFDKIAEQHEVDLSDRGLDGQWPRVARAVSIVKTAIDVVGESLELGIQNGILFLALINGNDDDKDKNNFAGIMAASILINMANVVLLHKYKRDRNYQPTALTIVNKGLLQSLEAASLINGLEQLWLYNGPGNVENRSLLAWVALGSGFLLNYTSTLLETILKRCGYVSKDNVDLYINARLRLQEAILSSLFVTTVAVDIACMLSNACDSDEVGPGIQATFYLAFLLSAFGIGTFRGLHLPECKPHRVPEPYTGETQFLFADDFNPVIESTIAINAPRN